MSRKYLKPAKKAGLYPRAEFAVQRTLVPHEKSLLVVPVLTLFAQLQVKVV